MLHDAMEPTSLKFLSRSPSDVMPNHTSRHAKRFVGPEKYLAVLDRSIEMVPRKIQANGLVASVDERLSSLDSLLEIFLSSAT